MDEYISKCGAEAKQIYEAYSRSVISNGADSMSLRKFVIQIKHEVEFEMPTCYNYIRVYPLFWNEGL